MAHETKEVLEFNTATLGAATHCDVSILRRPRRPLILAVLGASSSGKSTLAALLAQKLNSDAGATALCQDESFDYGGFERGDCPLKLMPDGRVWKNWESPDAISWPSFLSRVRDFIASSEHRRVAVIEGFILLGNPESAAMFDAIVSIEVPKDEAWKRRRGRALSMAHLPPGIGVLRWLQHIIIRKVNGLVFVEVAIE